MSIRNLILSIKSVTVSYLIGYDSLLQNAICITTKRDCYFITNATKAYYKMPQVFLLQNTTVIPNCDDSITKCESYFKMRCLLQIATVHMIFWICHFLRYIIHNFKIIQWEFCLWFLNPDFNFCEFTSKHTEKV